ncbi:MAG: tetratricopeptide repeat protein [Bacteroidales bacterium]|jgi:tetratricopeptide (TPR) repeat protein|nr:tetratricopeptide repeat protein [Bacteroidales bacterium]
MKKPATLLICTILFLLNLACLAGQVTLNEADIAIARKDYRRALEICSYLEKESGSTPELSLRKGIIEAAMSNFPSALAYLLEAEKGGAGSITSGLLIAECHEALGDIKSASARYEELIRTDRSNLYVINSYARMLISNRMYSDAIKWCQLLVDSVPGNPVFRKNLGGCFIQEGMDESALIHLRESWNMNDRDLNVLVSLTNTWLRLKIPAAGIPVTTEAILTHIGNPIPYRCHGNLLFALQQFEASATAYLEAYNLGDTSVTVARQLGFSYFASNQFREAIPYLMIYYRSDTANYEASYYLGVAMSAWRMKNEGIEMLRRTIDLMTPDSVRIGAIHASIGQAYSDQNLYPKAIESYRNALRYAPGEPDYLIGMARVYDGNKNLSEALEYYEAYDAHQNEMIRRLAASGNISPDSFVLSFQHQQARERIKKIKEELFLMGDIKKINS